METTKKALFVGFDGAQYSRLQELMAEGKLDHLAQLDRVVGYIGGDLGTTTQQPTNSGPGWSTLLTGTWGDQHGVTSNNGRQTNGDSIFELIDANVENARIASVVNWAPINTGHFGDEIASDVIDDNAQGLSDAAATAEVLRLINEDDAPDFTFVQLDEPDVVGHGHGTSKTLDNALIRAVEQLGEMLEAVEARKITHPEEDWMVIVATDHGRTADGYNHGGQSPTEREIFIGSNKDLGDFDQAVPATSLSATILDHFGIDWTQTNMASGSLLEGAGDPILPRLEDVAIGMNEFGFAETDGDLTLTFSEDVQVEQGAIEIRSAADDSVVLSIDVASDAISIDGHIVTVALPELGHDQSLYAAVQAGAFSDGSHGMRAAEGAVFTTAPEGAMRTVFSEDFEGLTNQLGAYVSASESGGDGTDWTGTAPEGWSQENDTPTGGPQEFHGWTFHDKASWIDTAADQGRSDFTLADGVVAVVDPDEYDDIGNIDPNLFDAALKTPEIDISGLKAGSLTLSFASSWMPEDSQQARLLVSYDGGEPVEVLNWSSDSGSANYKSAATNEQVTLQLDNPAGAQTAKVIFDMPRAGNDWWWAIDNIKMVGTDAPKAEIHGTAGNDRLIGTDGDDILFSDGGRSDFMTGGLGADVFTFNEVVDNDLRQTLTITDYEIGLDRIDIGDATVARYVERASGVTLMLEGDMDAVTVRGVSHYDDLSFV